MNALEKIIDGILAQAAVAAEEILDAARTEAAGILEKGRQDRAELTGHLEESAERECREILSRAKSADRQSRRLAILEVKNRVVDEVIFEAKKKLAENPENFKSEWQGNILLNNSIDAVFEAENQSLRDKAYEVLAARV